MRIISVFILAWLGLASGVSALPPSSANTYPPETAREFMRSCAPTNPRLKPYCNCVIENIQKVIPIGEFTMLTQQNQMANDKRYLTIVQRCIQQNAP